jgi:hypothetical protein
MRQHDRVWQSQLRDKPIAVADGSCGAAQGIDGGGDLTKYVVDRLGHWIQLIGVHGIQIACRIRQIGSCRVAVAASW